jgi:3-hydroxyacyl-[acyl-carrier-protein] dehydratase
VTKAIAVSSESRDACAGKHKPLMNPNTHSEKFHIAAEHPALPGHFPGTPVVPGVILLDRVTAAIEHAWELRANGFPQVKFLRPLGPDQTAELTIERDAAGVRFRVVAGAAVIASGTIVVVP